MAMMTQLKSTFAFFALFVVIFATLSLCYEYRIRAKDTYYQHYDYFAREDTQPEVLIFGDSRGVYGLRNSLLGGRIFNYSYFAENYATHYIRLADAIEKKKNLKAIVIPLDLHSISEHRNTRSYSKTLYFSDFDTIRQQYPKTHFLDNLQGRIEAAFPILNRVEFTALVKAFGYDFIALLRNQERTRQRGFDENLDLSVPKFNHWSDYESSEQIRKAHTNAKRKLENKGFSENVYQAQQDIIRLARQNGLKIFGLKYPVRPEYYASAQHHADPKIIESYKSLELDSILDYRHSYKEHPSLFEDADHLNQQGAKRFSLDVRKALEESIS